MNDDEITRDEWDALGDAQLRDLLAKEWNKPYVSLSAAVHWIATCGEPREADSDELNDAALKLVRALHAKGKLTAQGVPAAKSEHEPVPRTALLNAPAFFDDGRETEAFRNAIYLDWNQFLEGNRSDVITDRCGTIHWRDLFIDGTDMRSLWRETTNENDNRKLRPIALSKALEILSANRDENAGRVLGKKAAEQYLRGLGYRGRDIIRDAVDQLTGGRTSGER